MVPVRHGASQHELEDSGEGITSSSVCDTTPAMEGLTTRSVRLQDDDPSAPDKPDKDDTDEEFGDEEFDEEKFDEEEFEEEEFDEDEDEELFDDDEEDEDEEFNKADDGF